MEILKDVIKTPKIVFAQTKEQSVEADLLLPDYYPEISKILDCCVSLCAEAVALTADRISVSGAANVRLLYASAENELGVYETTVKYTKLISGGPFETADVPVVRQTVSAVNFRAVSPRRVEVRASAAVSAQVLRMEETQFVKDASSPALQKRTASANVFRLNAYAMLKTEIEEKLSLPVPKQEISGILRQSVKIVWSDVKTVDNKIMLNGSAEIAFTYVSRDNAVSRECTVAVPFTQIKELYGANEGDECRLSLLQAEALIDLKSGGESEAGLLIRFVALAAAGRQEELTYIDDAFALKGGVELRRCRKELLCGLSVQTLAVPFSGEAQAYDFTVADICDKYVSDIAFSATQTENGAHIAGTLTLKLLARTAEGAYYSFSRSCSFESVGGPSAILPGAAAVVPLGVSVEKTPEGVCWKGELEFRCVAAMNTEAQLIADACENEEGEAKNGQNIVLYYGVAGEAFWDIAKENRTALSSLMELNGLEGDALKENKLLIFRS